MRNTLFILTLPLLLLGCETPQEVSQLHSASDIQNTVVAKNNSATLWVNGIGCPGCIPSVEEPMMKLSGVENVSVELQTGIVTVTLDPNTPVTTEQLEGAIEDGGFTLTKIEMSE